jgi:hypothetical protein
MFVNLTFLTVALVRLEKKLPPLIVRFEMVKLPPSKVPLKAFGVQVFPAALMLAVNV